MVSLCPGVRSDGDSVERYFWTVSLVPSRTQEGPSTRNVLSVCRLDSILVPKDCTSGERRSEFEVKSLTSGGSDRCDSRRSTVSGTVTDGRYDVRCPIIPSGSLRSRPGTVTGCLKDNDVSGGSVSNRGETPDVYRDGPLHPQY